MSSLVRFLRRPLRDKIDLIRAAAMVGTTRAALAVLPFRTVLRGADALASRPRRGGIDPGERGRMVLAVESAARYVLPAGPCLSQAIVVDILLRRRGLPSELRIGVAKGPSGKLQAHAWVESEGEVLIGGPESPAEFYTFPDPRRAR